PMVGQFPNVAPTPSSIAEMSARCVSVVRRPAAGAAPVQSADGPTRTATNSSSPTATSRSAGPTKLLRASRSFGPCLTTTQTTNATSSPTATPNESPPPLPNERAATVAPPLAMNAVITDSQAKTTYSNPNSGMTVPRDPNAAFVASIMSMP